MDFDLSIITFLIVCPLTFLGGFVDAVAGGGGLISLPAYMIAGLPVHNAIATNKLSSGMGTTVATYRLASLGYIPWRKAALCIVMAIIGSSTGAKLALMVDADLFKKLMLVIIPLTAIYVMRNKNMDEPKEPLGDRETVIRASLVALLIGVYDGFYGPGTGTFLILLLSGFAHISLKESNGIAKSINLTTNLSSLAVYLRDGNNTAGTGRRAVRHSGQLYRRDVLQEQGRQGRKTADDNRSGHILHKDTDRDNLKTENDTNETGPDHIRARFCFADITFC